MTLWCAIFEYSCNIVVQPEAGQATECKMLSNFSHGQARSSTPPFQKEANPASRTNGVQDHEAGLWTKLIFWRTKRRYGHIPLSTRIRARDPRLLALAERMNRYIAGPGDLSPKLKELVQLKVAAMVGCPF
jgi:hypothetical protein